MKKETSVIIAVGLGGFLLGLVVFLGIMFGQNRSLEKKIAQMELLPQATAETPENNTENEPEIVEVIMEDENTGEPESPQPEDNPLLAPMDDFPLGEIAHQEINEKVAASIIMGSVPVDENNKAGKYTVGGKTSRLPWNLDLSGWQFEGYLNEWEAIRSSMECTAIINGIDRQLIKNSKLDFSDLKITIIGDEMVTGGNLSAGDAEKYSLASQLKAVLGCKEVLALGVNDSTISRISDKQPLVDRWASPPKDSDIVIVMAGTNDILTANWEQYGYLDYEQRMIPGTFCGDIDEIFTGMNIVYHEQVTDKYIKLMCINPPCTIAADYRRNGDPDNIPSQEEFSKAYMYAVPPYNVDLVDMYNSNFLSTRDENVRNNFFTDDMHPNEKGYRLMAERIAGEIISRCFPE